MTEIAPVGDVDSRKLLNKYINNMVDKSEAAKLKTLIKEYGLQREIEAYEEVKDLLSDPGDSEVWVMVDTLPVSAFQAHVEDTGL